MTTRRSFLASLSAGGTLVTKAAAQSIPSSQLFWTVDTTSGKVQGIAAYGYADTSLSSYEEDHLLPLELGGAPRDPKNLWPEPHTGSQNAYSKDGVENAVKKAVCAGRATLRGQGGWWRGA